MGRTWLGFLNSDGRKNQKKKSKGKKGWGCVSRRDFEADSVEYSAPQKSLPIVHEIDREKQEEVFEFVSPTNSNKYSGIPSEDVAAIKIQTSFRCFLARRELSVLRGLSRLKLLTSSNAVKRQTAATLQYMQTMTGIKHGIDLRINNRS